MSGFLNNSVRVYPIKLKLGMLDHMNNTFRNTAFQISVDVPLKSLYRERSYCEMWQGSSISIWSSCTIYHLKEHIQHTLRRASRSPATSKLRWIVMWLTAVIRKSMLDVPGLLNFPLILCRYFYSALEFRKLLVENLHWK